MGFLHTQRITAAVALAPPVPGMTLSKIRVFAGTTPGALGILFNGRSNAWFPAPSDGTSGFMEYDVSWLIPGTNVPAAAVTFAGGLAAVELVYSTEGSGGPAIESYRGIRFARTDGGAVNAGITVAFDEAPASPRQIVGCISASRGRASFPATGSLTFAHEVAPARHIARIADCTSLPAANDLTLTVVTDAAATSQYVVYY